jgi:hypothetical protein
MEKTQYNIFSGQFGDIFNKSKVSHIFCLSISTFGSFFDGKGKKRYLIRIFTVAKFRLTLKLQTM